MIPPPPYAIALLVLQAAQLLVIAWLASAVLKLRRTPARTDNFESLARSLEGPFQRLAADWQAEHQRLAALGAEAAELVARLRRLQLQLAVGGEPAPSAETPPLPGPAARDQARALLSSGESVAETAAATGLPEGEVRVLANILRVRNEPEAS
jgi:hypothetical protein